VKNEYFGLATMIGTMLALGIWLFYGVLPAEKNPGKLRVFLTLIFSFTLTVGGFLTFVFAREWGSHFAAINMMLFGVACLQYTFRTIEIYSVRREPVSDTPAFNIDGAPMIGRIDINGNPYGIIFSKHSSVFDED